MAAVTAHPSPSPNRYPHLIGVGLAALSAFPLAGWLLLTPANSLGSAQAGTNTLVAAAVIGAIAAAVAAYRTVERQRVAWQLLAAAAALWGLSEAAAELAPGGSLAGRLSGILGLLACPAAVGGLVTLAQPGGTSPGVRVITGATATTLSMMALLWSPVLAPIVESPAIPLFDRLTLAATAIVNLGLVFGVFIALQDRESRDGEAVLVILAVGAAFITAGNLGITRALAADSLHYGVHFDVVRAVGLSLIGFAAAGQVRHSPDYALNSDQRRSTSLVRQTIPLVTSVAALGFAALQPGAFARGVLPALVFTGVAAAVIHEVLVLYDQLQLNNLLRTSEAALQRRHALVVNSSPDLIAVVGVDGRYEYLNPAYGRLLGYRPSDLIGTPVLHMVDRRDTPSMFAFLTMARSDPGSNGTATLRFKGADGRFRVFECGAHPLRDEDGRVKSLVMVSRDITERQAAERRLRNSEARKGALFSSAPDAILSVDADGIITECNPAAEVLFDMDAVDLGGFSLSNVITMFDSEPSPPFKAMRERLEASEGNVHGVPCVAQRADGSEFPAEVSVSQVEGVGLGGFIVFVRDVTERVRVETQLRDSQKLEAIGRLAGGVAHDFNNLLTVIHGYAEFARSQAEVDGQLQEDVGEIIRASERAKDLTRQLLAFARRQVVEPKIVSPNELVSGMQKMLGRLVGEDIPIHTDLDEDTGHINIDPGQFEQVIVNLVVNARDAMPKGGTVTITTRDVGPAEVARLAPGLEPGNYVLISVSDTGVGMSRETMDHVFEPFFSTKGPGAGVGLGLATCYGIVKQSSGEITVESEVGRGTTFRVWLPQSVRNDTALERPVPREVQGGYETILFVEDERGVRTLTERYLRSLGYRVIVAGDGHEALRTLQTSHEPIHLLISDVVMPRMSGLDLADRVLSRSPGTHILFISGYPRDVLAERGVLPREVSLLPKPFTFEALALRVRDALDRTRPIDGAEGSTALDPVAAEVERRLRERHTA